MIFIIIFFLSFDSQRRMFKDGMKGNIPKLFTEWCSWMTDVEKKKVAKDDSIQKEERK